jgi:hypothetical protein
MAQIGTFPDHPALKGIASPRGRFAGLRSIEGSRAFPALLLAPIMIFFLVWNVVPLVWLLGVSFYKYKVTSSREPAYVGFDNFTDLWRSSEIWGLIGRTLTFMVDVGRPGDVPRRAARVALLGERQDAGAAPRR